MEATITEPPLIVTLKMDEVSQAFFDVQRAAYFPAYINYLNAHITLFHKLPSDEVFILEPLSLLSRRSDFLMTVSSVKHIGNGVVYTIESDELHELHKKLQVSFKPWLTGKDAQKLWPHITVQNKVTNYKSEQLYKKLSEGFQPFSIMALGFQTWHYLNGPWSMQQEILFSG